MAKGELGLVKDMPDAWCRAEDDAMRRLMNLLGDPHPGLFTWASALVTAQNDLRDLYRTVPQLVTDAQRDGGKYLLWFPEPVRATVVFCGHDPDLDSVGPPDPISFGPILWPAGWYVGWWGSEIHERVPGFSIASWNIGNREMRAGVILFGNATHYLPAPADMEKSSPRN